MSAQTDPNAAPPPEPDPNAPTVTLEDVQRKLNSVEASNAGLRGELKKRDDALKKLTDAQLTDQEKVAKERDDYKAQVEARDRQLAEVSIQTDALRIASRLGFTDPGDAFALLDRTALQLDAGGKAINLEELLRGILTAKPYLSGGSAGPTGGTTNPGTRAAPMSGKLDMNEVFRAKING